jgi:hypothetical protein
VHWRRLVAATSRAADGALLPLVVDLLRDQDPAGIVPILALEVPDRLPIAAIVAALDAEVAAVRTGAWQAIQRLNMWDQGLVAPMEEAVQLLAPHLQKAFGDPDPETARTAFAFLCTKAAGTRAGSDLLLDWLPRVPSFSASMVQVALKGSLAAVLRAAKALGPVGSTDGKGERRSVVVRLTVETVRSDPAPTVAAICELVELGYEPPHSSVLKYAVPLARSDEDWLRIGALLDRCTDPLEVMQEFRERDLPGGMVPALQQRLASVLRELPAGDTQTPQPNSLRNEVHMLFDALGRTGNPAAVAFLR